MLRIHQNQNNNPADNLQTLFFKSPDQEITNVTR